MADDAEDPTGRALALLSCLTGRPHWSGAELAARLGVTTRTVRRDVERLRRLGYEVDAAAGTDGGYRLRAGAVVPPLFLEDDEAVAVVTALLAATGRAATGMADASSRALAKLHHVLPARVRGRAEAVRRASRTVATGGGPTVHPDRIAVLAECCRDGAAVRFAYVARDGRATQRRIEPHALITLRSVWYLVCFDLDRQDWRAFRIDRIEGEVERTGHAIARRTIPGGDPLTFLGNTLAEMPFTHTAEVEVATSRDDALGRLRWLNARRVTSTGPTSCHVRLGAGDVGELARQVIDVVGAGSVTAVRADALTSQHLARIVRSLGDVLNPRVASG